MSGSRVDTEFLERANRPDVQNVLREIVKQGSVAYDLLEVDRGETPIGALEDQLVDCSATAKQNFSAALEGLIEELINKLDAKEVEALPELINAVSLAEIIVAEQVLLENSALIDVLAGLALRQKGELQRVAINVLSQIDSLRALSALEVILQENPRQPDIIPALLLSKSIHDPLTALDIDAPEGQWRRLIGEPAFLLALKIGMEKMFEVDGEMACLRIVSNVKNWPAQARSLVLEILSEPPLTAEMWALRAAKELPKTRSERPRGTQVARIRTTPTSPEVPSKPTIADARTQGTVLGARLAGTCGAGEKGDRRFENEWKRFLTISNYLDDARPNQRLLFMSALRSFRESKIEADFQAVQSRLSRGNKLESKSALRTVLGLDHALWGQAQKLLRKLQELHREAVREQWKKDIDIFQLTIGVSRYAEEVIAAQIAIDLCKVFCENDIFNTAYAPWGQQTIVGNHSGLNDAIGGADIRLTNLGAKNGDPVTSSEGTEPVFRHRGYRAYASSKWLMAIQRQKSTPGAVRGWISKALAAQLNDRSLYDEQNLSARAWIALSGRPVNYTGTEFLALFRYLNSAIESKFDKISIEKARDADPDKVFEGFILGKRNVLMSGSVHDMLLEEFWVSKSKDFTRILGPNDFDPLYKDSDLQLGLNSISFSERLDHYPEIRKAVRQLFATIFQVLTNVAREPSNAKRRHGILEYVSKKLIDGQRELNVAGIEPRWSFIGSTQGLIRILTNDTSVISSTDSIPYHTGKVVAFHRTSRT